MENESWSFAPGGTPKQTRPATSEGRPEGVPPPPPVPHQTPASVPFQPPAAVPPEGSPVQQVVYQQQIPAQRSTNGMATASLVVGIVGFFLPILSILAVIFGGIGISRANQGAAGKGQAVAGLVLGMVGILVLLYAAGQATT